MKLASLLFVALLSAPSFAHADGSCTDGWNDTETYDLDGSDLALHSGAPEGWEAYGHAACIYYDDQSLDQFRVKVEKAFRKHVEGNFVKHLKQGLPASTDLVCRFDDTKGLLGQGSFDDVTGTTALDKSLAKTECRGNQKRNHFAYVKIPYEGAGVKMRCGTAELMKRWEQACGQRAPASVKAKKK